MNKYAVKMLPRAYGDLDSIYGYIAKTLHVPDTAGKMITELEEGILSLGELPERGALRKIGPYAKKGYRQFFVKNFTIIYRVDQENKQIIVVTVRYSRSHF